MPTIKDTQAAEPAQINGEPATAHSLLAALLDIYDDSEWNSPENRSYIESAYHDVLELSRKFLAAPSAPDSAAPSSLSADPALSMLVSEWARTGGLDSGEDRYLQGYRDSRMGAARELLTALTRTAQAPAVQAPEVVLSVKRSEWETLSPEAQSRLLAITGAASRNLARAQAGAKVLDKPLCTQPPEGWTCSRGAGHEGPCASSSAPGVGGVEDFESFLLRNGDPSKLSAPLREILRQFFEAGRRAGAAGQDAALLVGWELLDQAAYMCECYADWIKRNVMSANVEEHPYLPELEGVAEDLRAALAAQGDGGTTE